MVHVLYPSVSCSSYLSYRYDGTDKKEKENLSKLIYLILIPAFVLIILILTNDFHQLAFAFKATEENSVVEYTHRIIFI